MGYCRRGNPARAGSRGHFDEMASRPSAANPSRIYDGGAPKRLNHWTSHAVDLGSAQSAQGQGVSVLLFQYGGPRAAAYPRSPRWAV